MSNNLDKFEFIENGIGGVWKLAHSSPKCIIINLLFTFGSKSNNNLQLGAIVNHEVIVFKIFFQNFNMAGKYLSKFSTIPKIMN
jgi:hypothetical protein